MEGADQVLALRQVHRGLAADGAVDHRQQRGRQLHETHAAHPAGGGEAGQVADHAAAQGQHGGVAAGAHVGKHLGYFGEAGQGLFLFAGRQHAGLHLLFAQGRLHPRQVVRGHVGVGQHQGVPAGHQGRQGLGLVEQAAADADGVAPVAQRDLEFVDFGHAASGRRHWLLSSV